MKQKAFPGDKIDTSHLTHNYLLDGADIAHGVGVGTGVGVPVKTTGVQRAVRYWNDTGAAIQIGQPMSVEQVLGVDDTLKSSRELTIRAKQPVDGEWGVSVTVTQNDAIGWAIFSGVFTVEVVIDDAGHKYAEVVEGVLRSTVAGQAQILWKESATATGKQKCLIRLGQGQPGQRYAEVPVTGIPERQGETLGAVKCKIYKPTDDNILEPLLDDNGNQIEATVANSSTQWIRGSYDGSPNVIVPVAFDGKGYVALTRGQVAVGRTSKKIPPFGWGEVQECWLNTTETDNEPISVKNISDTEIDKDVYLICHYYESENGYVATGPPPGGGSSGDSDGSVSDSYAGSYSGSGKDTAIVPASWSTGGYTALFVVESPDVRFTDVLTLQTMKERTKVAIDSRFVEVCERGSIVVVGVVSSVAERIGAIVVGDFVVVSREIAGVEAIVTVTLSGVRRGFDGLRFPDKTRDDFVRNERWINRGGAV